MLAEDVCLTLGNLGLPILLLAVCEFANLSSYRCFLMVLVGMGQVFQNTLANTLLQITSPDDLRGRVMSQYSLVTQGMHQLGGLQAGFVADWIGAPLSVGIGASLSLALWDFCILHVSTRSRNGMKYLQCLAKHNSIIAVILMNRKDH